MPSHCPTCNSPINDKNQMRPNGRRCDTCHYSRKHQPLRPGRSRNKRVGPQKQDGHRVRRDLGVPSSDRLEYRRRYRLVLRALRDVKKLGLTSSKAIDECAALGIKLEPEPFSNCRGKVDLYKIPLRLRQFASSLPVTPPFLRCAKCGEEKTPRSFSRSAKGPYGYHSYCNCCRRAYEAKARAEGRRNTVPKDLTTEELARARELRKAWRIRNKMHLRKYSRDYQRKFREKRRAEANNSDINAAP